MSTNELENRNPNYRRRILFGDSKRGWNKVVFRADLFQLSMKNLLKISDVDSVFKEKVKPLESFCFFLLFWHFSKLRCRITRGQTTFPLLFDVQIYKQDKDLDSLISRSVCKSASSSTKFTLIWSVTEFRLGEKNNPEQNCKCRYGNWASSISATAHGWHDMYFGQIFIIYNPLGCNSG